MRRPARRLEGPVGHPAPAGDEGLLATGHPAGFQHEERPHASARFAHRRGGDPAAGLLVGDAEELDVDEGAIATGGEHVEGGHEHGETRLHVERAAGEEAPAVEARGRGGQDGVQVADEEQPRAAGHRGPGVEHGQRGVAGAGQLPDLDREPAARELGPEALADLPDPGGVAALRRDAAEIREQRRGGVVDRCGLDGPQLVHMASIGGDSTIRRLPTRHIPPEGAT